MKYPIYSKFNFVVIILFLPSIIAGCGSEPKPVTEEEAYEAINDLIFQDTIIEESICGSFADMGLTNEMENYFSSEDFEFIEQQKKITRQLKPNRIVYFHGGYKEGDFAKLNKNCEYGSQYSYPLFTTDRKKMLIHIEYHSEYYGSTGDFVYLKKNGRWKLIKSFNESKWIALFETQTSDVWSIPSERTQNL